VKEVFGFGLLSDRRNQGLEREKGLNNGGDGGGDGDGDDDGDARLRLRRRRKMKNARAQRESAINVPMTAPAITPESEDCFFSASAEDTLTLVDEEAGVVSTVVYGTESPVASAAHGMKRNFLIAID